LSQLHTSRKLTQLPEHHLETIKTNATQAQFAGSEQNLIELQTDEHLSQRLASSDDA